MNINVVAYMNDMLRYPATYSDIFDRTIRRLFPEFDINDGYRRFARDLTENAALEMLRILKRQGKTDSELYKLFGVIYSIKAGQISSNQIASFVQDFAARFNRSGLDRLVSYLNELYAESRLDRMRLLEDAGVDLGEDIRSGDELPESRTSDNEVSFGDYATSKRKSSESSGEGLKKKQKGCGPVCHDEEEGGCADCEKKEVKLLFNKVPRQLLGYGMHLTHGKILL
jgi:hypothetical protein